jgi:tripartite-type tricarboxylate transporter receptor subunit TctC
MARLIAATSVPNADDNSLSMAASSAKTSGTASSGVGSGPHVAGELFKMMADINMVHVPYRGEALAMNE